MTFEYVSVEDAIARRGLRMVVLGKVPSPWGEAAKGIFHIKRIDFAAVRLVYDNPALESWAGTAERRRWRSTMTNRRARAGRRS